MRRVKDWAKPRKWVWLKTNIDYMNDIWDMADEERKGLRKYA